VAFRFPVAVLIDPSTASAAEIFSGAIEPLPRVTTIGQTSFGKGLIQSVVPLPEDNLLKVTVGEYLLSDDRVIHDKGLKPDIALFPVSRENLGALSARPENSMAYLLPASGDDEAPIEMGRLLLDHGQPRAVELFRERADREIALALEQIGLGVRWAGGESIQKAQLMQPLLIEGGAPSALRGEATTVSICASNPNRVAVPSAWAALGGLPFLANKLISLGTIEPQQKACGKVEVKPEDGLTSSPVPIEVLISSGPHPLQTQKVQLLAEDHAPRLQIEVVRSAPQALSVTLTNSGCCGTGAIRVAVPGALRSLENLLPRESKTVELPLTGKARMVNVLVAGIGASQRIDVPVPETRVLVVPPEVHLSQQTVLGKHQLRVTASAPEGLREGWIATSHDAMQFPQKELYVAWGGDAEGQMWADLVTGDNSVTTKVETVSGVAVLDVRNVTTR
jgi:hypothetical protein